MAVNATADVRVRLLLPDAGRIPLGSPSVFRDRSSKTG